MKKIIVFVVSLLILPTVQLSSVYAQEANEKESVEEKGDYESKKLLAGKIFQLAGIDKELKQVANTQIKLAILSRHLSNRATAGSKKEAEEKEKLTNALEKVFENDVNIIDEMKPIIADQFATEFSKSELEYMVRFYQSELGQKLVKTTPLVAQEVVKQTMSKLRGEVNKALEAAIEEESAKVKAPQSEASE